eukprot:4831826-Pyramimonas_sp.AAC.1
MLASSQLGARTRDDDIRNSSDTQFSQNNHNSSPCGVNKTTRFDGPTPEIFSMLCTMDVTTLAT